MNKVLVITGASCGIGAATAQKAALLGFDIAINYRNNKQKAHELCVRLNSQSIRAVPIQADISTEQGAVHLFDQVDQQLGTVTHLVNNAGIISHIDRFENYSLDRIQTVFQTNVFGSFLCAQQAVKRMSYQHDGTGGAIVNVSSVAASLGSPNEFIDYAATKGAIDTFTVGLAKELAGEGIRVNAVRPGLIDTQMHSHAGDSKRIDKLQKKIPMQRAGHPDEVANTILWLLCDEASYITGSIVDVSGGR